MKRVSFKVAKAIKEAGYPQEYNIGDSWCYENGQYSDENELHPPISGWILLPTYLEVWLWLWQDKKIMIPVEGVYITQEAQASIIESGGIKCLHVVENSDLEEAIIAAIEYLVTNKLLK